MFRRLGRFFSPNQNAPLWIRIMPYATLIFAVLVVFGVAGAGWEYTNSNEFCGTSCHTMPAEYISFLESPHANVKCVECHIGRATIATQLTRKSKEITHVLKYAGAGYHLPVYTKSFRPATEVCEKCHNPEKFSADSLREFRHYDAEKNNEELVQYMSFKIGGGTAREGRGKGIHWHIENDIEYIAVDDPHLQQEIPWVRVHYTDSGESEEFIDVDADLPADFVEQNAENIKKMDCTSCHNRIAHKFPTPSAALNDSMARGVIDPSIPYFKQNALAVFEREYPNMNEARRAIQGLNGYYAVHYPDYSAANQETISAAVDEVLNLFQKMMYSTMEPSWGAHPDNLGHSESAGCFRCHDGKHLTAEGESIRIECNICHSIPIKGPEDGSSPNLALTESFEPESHIDTNWISRHRFEFDGTCEGCHDISSPGGADDSSFCANSSCHATEWTYAGLNAPGLIEMTNVLAADLPTLADVALTWDDLIGPILAARCVACHGGTAGLDLDSYAGAMAGGNLGPAIIPGDAEGSLLVQLQREGHPNSLAPAELDWVIQWIDADAPESQKDLAQRRMNALVAAIP